jgi:NADH-quinone oxidoreductase subunit G
VQRFRRAYPPRAGVLPHWRWAQTLGEALGAGAPQASSREVFLAHRGSVPELTGFDWDKEAPVDRRRPGINPLPTGADGRTPGYREFGTPRVRGV